MESENRDSAVTAYVRHRIREWEASGRMGKELALRAGISPAQVSQIKKRHGVGSGSIDGLARAFGFKSADEMRSRAYEWYVAQSGPVAEIALEPAVQSAIVTVMGLRPGVSREQIDTVLAAFAHPRWRGRSEEFWVPELLRELLLERAVEIAEQHVKKDATSTEYMRRRDVKGAMRVGHLKRKQKAEAAASEPPPATPQAPASTPAVAPKRKRA